MKFMRDLLEYAEYEEELDYEKAGQNAPPEVQKAIERWKTLPIEDRKHQPLLYWLLGSGTPDYKMSKEDAAYQEEPREKQKCGNCEFAYLKVSKDMYICSQMRGEINENAWCRLWTAGDHD